MIKLETIVLVIISIIVLVVSEGDSEEIKACVRKNGQLRIVNDHSECAVNEEAKTFDNSINYDMYPKEINETMRSSGQYMLTINKDGTGRGTVILSPSGVGSDSAPVQKYNKGTLVVLTASPDENSVFAGWKGDGCLGEGVCVLTMSSDNTVTATFHETNASGTVVIRNTEKSIVPAMNKKETEQHETKEDEKQTMEKPSQPQKSSETLYAIQVGAFRNASYAKSLEMMLTQKGYHAYILTSKSRIEGEFHKVLIGRFSDRAEAENLSKKIFKMENLRAFVTSCGTRQKELETKQ
jgi:cell division septation protein DedD